ncbi:hypothetical protein FNYG_06495 [Fusarium nygamai]|uniref:Methyltransferase domain-containing protein n=1 Tax=Gibberella nygamai TaxID=42673 RepID=A0A2K0WCW8_GIBNY|nr:hypothetical protein FNYG_06495 [Fusarium nygamai]
MSPRKTPEDILIIKFPEACSALLEQIVRAAGLLDDEDSNSGSRGSLAILDLGFGCGDQALQLAKLAEARGWSDFRYVGLTLNRAQVRTAWGRIHYEIDVTGSGQETDTDDSGFDTGFVVGVDSFALFCADAAKPETWRDEVAEAVHSLADEKYMERWLLALDCLYYFLPLRKPIFKYMA